MKTMFSYKWVAILCIVVGASSYGMLSPVIKLAFADGISEGNVTSAQVTMGALIMWLLVLVTPAARKSPFTGPWIKQGLIGMCSLSLTTIFYNRTLSELDASLAIVLLFQFTWITIVMECIAERKWPTRYQGGAIAVVMAGTIMSVNLLSADLSRFSVSGILFGLASGFTYSLFLFLAGRVESDQHPFLKSAWMLTAGLIVIYLFYPPVFLIGGAPDTGSRDVGSEAGPPGREHYRHSMAGHGAYSGRDRPVRAQTYRRRREILFITWACLQTRLRAAFTVFSPLGV